MGPSGCGARPLRSAALLRNARDREPTFLHLMLAGAGPDLLCPLLLPTTTTPVPASRRQLELLAIRPSSAETPFSARV